MVAELLHDLGYSLQANSKTLEGASHPDRDAQFEHINRQAQAAVQPHDRIQYGQYAIDQFLDQLEFASRNAVAGGT
jgi:hypothetical protein